MPPKIQSRTRSCVTYGLKRSILDHNVQRVSLRSVYQRTRSRPYWRHPLLGSIMGSFLFWVQNGWWRRVRRQEEIWLNPGMVACHILFVYIPSSWVFFNTWRHQPARSPDLCPSNKYGKMIGRKLIILMFLCPGRATATNWTCMKWRLSRNNGPLNRKQGLFCTSFVRQTLHISSFNISSLKCVKIV